MNESLKYQLEEQLRKTGKANGVNFKVLEANSASEELARFIMLEINYPSKEVIEMVDVEYPNPNQVGVMVHAQVERKTRVLMSPEEVAAYHHKLAKEDVITRFQDDPEGLKEYIEELKTKLPKAKKGAKK